VRIVHEHVAMPAIGTHIQIRRPNVVSGDEFQAAIVVGHLTDPVLGSVLELRLSDSRRMQRIWPSPSLRLGPGA
jgi:hypothetical protein